MALVVFTGGARSGKSSAAQALARRRAMDGQPVAAVVFGMVSEDPEMGERAARHQSERPAGFELLEAQDSRSWLGQAGEGSLLLIDCLGTLVGMVMSEEWPSAAAGHELVDAGSDLPLGYAESVESKVGELVRALSDRSGDTIVVTNEVGGGVVPAYGSGRLFRDVLGRANRALVSRADRSYLVVCGRLVELGGLSTSPAWPED
jgi:adenosylcobinamide kinase / adenosylcobinamide-phosphate guanylyltransferase